MGERARAARGCADVAVARARLVAKLELLQGYRDAKASTGTAQSSSSSTCSTATCARTRACTTGSSHADGWSASSAMPTSIVRSPSRRRTRVPTSAALSRAVCRRRRGCVVGLRHIRRRTRLAATGPDAGAIARDQGACRGAAPLAGPRRSSSTRSPATRRVREVVESRLSRVRFCGVHVRRPANDDAARGVRASACWLTSRCIITSTSTPCLTSGAACRAA